MKGQSRFLSKGLFGGSGGILAQSMLKFLHGCVGALGSGEAALLTNPLGLHLDCIYKNTNTLHLADCAVPNCWWFARAGIGGFLCRRASLPIFLLGKQCGEQAAAWAEPGGPKSTRGVRGAGGGSALSHSCAHTSGSGMCHDLLSV